MNKTQIDALLACIKNNSIDTAELYEYLNTIHPGDFHFTNGTHFPILLPGLVADGVFADENYYLTAYERIKGKTTKGRAENFCHNRDCVLPSWYARDKMVENRSLINSSLSQIGFPLLSSGEYWAEDDKSGEGSAGEGSIFQGGAPGDDIFDVGTWKNYRKYVRGCMYVSKNTEKVNFSESIEMNNLQTVQNMMLKGLKVRGDLFETYRQNKDKYPKAGCYLLKNGSWSYSTVYDQEAGIFVNPNLYLKLDLPEAELFDAEQTCVYLKARSMQIPEFFDLRQIAKAVSEINNAFKAIGMSRFGLPENVLKNCWCKESLDEALGNDAGKNPVKKRILFVGHQENVDVRYLILDDIWKNFSLD